MVSTVDSPKYEKKMIINDMMMANGIFRCGFLASSPVVAMQSNPVNPKKHFDAPAMMPAKPKGANPPTPAPLGTSDSGIRQFIGSAKS